MHDTALWTRTFYTSIFFILIDVFTYKIETELENILACLSGAGLDGFELWKIYVENLETYSLLIHCRNYWLLF